MILLMILHVILLFNNATYDTADDITDDVTI